MDANAVRLLINTVQELSLARNMESVMTIVKKAARKLANADGTSFVLRDGESCYYADEDAISPLWKGQRFPLSKCVSGWVMLNQQHVIIPDIYEDERVPQDAYRPTFVKSITMVPIRKISPLGAIGNYWAKEHIPTEEELELLQSLANITAVTIENVQMYTEMEKRVKDRTKELVAVNRELEAFAYSVSHDLQAPLRTIRKYINVLQEEHAEALTDQGQRIVTRITSNAEEMSHLISNLLEFFRTSRVHINKVNVPMTSLVNRICQKHHEEATPRKIEFIQHDLPEIPGDPSLLHQVWENLISNAVKYTRFKEEAVIEIGSETSKENEVTFYIKDNGAGFDMQNYHKLFGVFQRLHAAREFEGTGIGLAMVEKIISRHDGAIWANGAVQEGASFYFKLPV